MAAETSESKQVWTDNLYTEVAYWDHVISGQYKITERVEAFKQRAAGLYPFPPHLLRYLKPDRTTRILDVGAGPHTVIGLQDVPCPIEIVAIDPLAHEYDALFEKYKVTPAVRTVFGEAEKIGEYGLGKFDLTYSRNALDHSYDPITAIDAMVAATRDDGAVLFEGSVNEGEKNKYHGLHQWNFLPEGEDLVVWNSTARISLAEHLGSKAKVSAQAIQGTWYRVEVLPMSIG